MAKMTRLATTVTARYFPSNELTDAFYMDGRLTSKRETRSADITTDKEDRGFFFSVFSHATIPGADSNALPPYEPALRKLLNDVKGGRKTLDDQIGEMVNTAVSVTGRLKIQAENARSPFFAGFIVKDSEAFAITLGKGLTFLYRDDTLFPMTAADIKIDPVNTSRQKVDHFYNYCATKTATALCSNIAQLRVDDCIIACNRELYDALGQHELLRILYDAEDQCEAAGNVITEASAKMPNVPMQFLIAFVENVTAPEKGGFFGFGRKKNQKAQEQEAYIPDDEVPVTPEPDAVLVSATDTEPDVPEPLFFGNEPSNPLAEPLAEKPVAPAGPEDSIHINDEEMKPFGEAPKKTGPEKDEGGLVKPEDKTEAPGEQSEKSVDEKPEAEDAEEMKTEEKVKTAQKEEIASSETSAGTVWVSDPKDEKDVGDQVEIKEVTEKTESKKQTAEEESWDFISAVAGEDESPATESKSTVDDTGEETENEMGNFDFDGKDTPQYIPDDDDDEGTPLMFGDDEAVEGPQEEEEYTEEDYVYTDFSEDQIPSADDGYGTDGVAARNDGYYIPFDSEQPVQPIGTTGGDIPEMPIYDAPSYQPPTYFDEDFSGTGYEPKNSYSMGSFDMPEEDSDVRRDYPPKSSSGDDMDFSYGMPPAAPHSGSGYSSPRGNGPRPGGPPKPPPRPGQPRPRSGDPFDQDRGFDYGDTDRVFKRNSLWMVILGIVCVILIIVLIAVAINQCSGGDPKETDPVQSSQPSSSQQSETTTTSTSETDPTPPTVPGKEPIGYFEFSATTGYRTWWDLFYTVYDIDIKKETDPRIQTIISYNELESDYTPQPGDRIMLPPSSMLTSSD